MTDEEIICNAAAPSRRVSGLARRNPPAAAQHPNCPPALWRKLAKDYPLEAMKNPAVALYALEDPAIYAWEVLEQEFAEHWIARVDLPHRERELWLADWEEFVLPIFERAQPHDPRRRHAIQVHRDWANGYATGEDYRKARLAATSALHEAGGTVWRDTARAWDENRPWQWRKMLEYLRASLVE